MKKVLIVEDDPMLSEIYQKKFEKNGDFEVIRATSGVEAQEKTKQEKPDLVLLDLVLPEMDGFDVLEEIRKDSTLDDVKIVPFSNLSQEDNKKKLKDLGADGFISKSEHTPQQLVDEVIRILADIKDKDEETVAVKIASPIKKTLNNKKGILIVEDDEVFLDVFGNNLSQAGFDVEKAMSGKEGMDILMQREFGVVIVDIVLPDMDARSMISEFKTKTPKAKTKFVILKNDSDLEKDVDALKKLGVKAVVDKNKVSPDQFSEEIGRILK